jgi:putrescine aminotransferase
MGRFWHSFADMAAVGSAGELVIDRGEGVHIWDETGRRYLDATAGLWYCNVGYGRAEIAGAAHRQLQRLSAYSTFGDLANRPAIELCERVSALAPVADSRVFLTSGGSDSTLLAAARPSGPDPVHHPGARLPRHAHRGNEPRRHRGERDRLWHVRG